MTMAGEEAFANAHTAGRVCPSTTVKIVDSAGVEVGPGEPGELWARGPQITMGYLGNGEATRETYEGGFLKTGDVAVVDGEGRVCIVERIKEMIKVNGVQVAPAELEDLLLGHEKVEDVAVVGVSHESMGEVPRAFVVVKEGWKKGEELERELVEYVKVNRGARTKWLRGGVRFVESVPKSPSGKILRRLLRDRVKGEVVKAKL